MELLTFPVPTDGSFADVFRKLSQEALMVENAVLQLKEERNAYQAQLINAYATISQLQVEISQLKTT